MAQRPRIKLELTPDSIKAIDDIQVLLDASTRAEAARRSIHLVHILLQKRADGVEIVLRKDGEEEVLVFS